jgi:hypothetical protein
LLVPVCVSSSHIAYGSIRMEPVFMILGQSAATAAVMAIEGRHAVEDLEYESLRLFETDLDRGRFEVRIVYPHNKNRTTAANIVIQTASGVQRLSLDQTQKPSVDDAIESLGVFEFDGPSSVSFSVDSENGFLVIDAAEFMKVAP